MGVEKNIFVSHHHKDDTKVKQMTNLVKKHGVDPKNYSIDSSKPNNAKSEKYIKNNILMPRIKACSTLVVLIGKGTHDRPYVNWEIEQANRLGKRIIGVYERGGSENDVPDNLNKFGDALVKWDGKKIAGGIKGSVNEWQNNDSNGSQRAPYWTIGRTTCGVG